MESQFGEYITKEYGLLKQILSYLKPGDLWSARQVCRAWYSAIETLIDRNPIVLSYNTGKRDIPKVTKTVLADLVICQSSVFGKREKCAICKAPFFLCPCKTSCPSTVYVLLNVDNDCIASRSQHDIEADSLYKFWQLPSAVLLSSSQDIKIYSRFIEPNLYLKEITDETIDKVTGGCDPIKCMLAISSIGPENKWINSLLSKITARQGLTFAVGGGVITGIDYKRGVSLANGKWKKKGLLLITFRGKNMSAQSEIIRSRNADSIEKSMIELKKKAGDIPEGGTRIAFIAQCVDRTSINLEMIENTLFKKYFEDLPLFGFRAWGEYGIKSCSSDNFDLSDAPRVKRKKLNFCHAHTTSIVILTLKKV